MVERFSIYESLSTDLLLLLASVKKRNFMFLSIIGKINIWVTFLGPRIVDVINGTHFLSFDPFFYFPFI